MFLYDTGTRMSYMSYTYHMKPKDLPLFKIISAMSVHSAIGHKFCAAGFTCSEVTIGKTQFKLTFIMCKQLQKELVTGLDI